MILWLVTLCSSPRYAFEGNEWPSRFFSFFFKGFLSQVEATKSHGDESGCQWSFVSATVLLMTAVPSQRDSEWEGLNLSRWCQAARQSCDYVSGPWYCGADRRGGGVCLVYLQIETYCSMCWTATKLHLSYPSSAPPNHFSPFPTCYLIMSRKCLKCVKRRRKEKLSVHCSSIHATEVDISPCQCSRFNASCFKKTKKFKRWNPQINDDMKSLFTELFMWLYFSLNSPIALHIPAKMPRNTDTLM